MNFIWESFDPFGSKKNSEKVNQVESHLPFGLLPKNGFGKCVYRVKLAFSVFGFRFQISTRNRRRTDVNLQWLK